MLVLYFMELFSGAHSPNHPLGESGRNLDAVVENAARTSVIHAACFSLQLVQLLIKKNVSGTLE